MFIYSWKRQRVSPYTTTQDSHLHGIVSECFPVECQSWFRLADPDQQASQQTLDPANQAACVRSPPAFPLPTLSSSTEFLPNTNVTYQLTDTVCHWQTDKRQSSCHGISYTVLYALCDRNWKLVTSKLRNISVICHSPVSSFLSHNTHTQVYNVPTEQVSCVN